MRPEGSLPRDQKQVSLTPSLYAVLNIYSTLCGVPPATFCAPSTAKRALAKSNGYVNVHETKPVECIHIPIRHQARARFVINQSDCGHHPHLAPTCKGPS